MSENNQKNKKTVGRPRITKWPGLEKIYLASNNYDGPLIKILSRSEELEMASEEAKERELLYSQMNNLGAAIFDLYNLKFDCSGQPAHTTIDIGSWSAEADPRITLTTNDFRVYNKCKKLIFTPDQDLVPGIEVTDLKFNQTYSAVFFVTISGPLSLLKKIFNKQLI